MKVSWSTGNLLSTGVYWIEYYIGNTKKKTLELLNYFDDLIPDEGDGINYMFESFDNDDTIIINSTKILRHSLVEKPEEE